ncbi:unnamed protein product [Closterium sp. NIES-65]|nr:unnamed protein product [Closterium sp. NIES-65]
MAAQLHSPDDEMTLIDDFHSRYAPPETRSGGNSLSWGGCGGNSRRSDHAHFEALAAVSLMLQCHPRAPGFIWEVLRIIRHAYARLYFGLLRTAFAHTFHLPNSRSVLLKVYDDPGFLRIPTVINFEDDSPPALLNISSHVCSFCGNNHRDVDHEIFPTKRRQRDDCSSSLTPNPPLPSLSSLTRVPPHPPLWPASWLAGLSLGSQDVLAALPFPQPAYTLLVPLTPSYAPTPSRARLQEPTPHLQVSLVPHPALSHSIPPPSPAAQSSSDSLSHPSSIFAVI